MQMNIMQYYFAIVWENVISLEIKKSYEDFQQKHKRNHKKRENEEGIKKRKGK